MSTNHRDVESEVGSAAVTTTSFFGGVDKGRCLQLTQSTSRTSGQKDMFQLLQLDHKQAVELAKFLLDWTQGDLGEGE